MIPVEIWPVEMVPLADLKRHPRNFREHDTGAIAASISRWGTWRPLVVQKSTGYVLVGNGEMEALGWLGKSEAPVRWIEVDDENALAILLADNWLPSRGRNMPDELLEVMQELALDREMFEFTGADADDVEALEREVADLDKPLKLDSRKMVRKTKVKCPECGHEFVPAKKET
jgi:hypothetical protein